MSEFRLTRWGAMGKSACFGAEELEKALAGQYAQAALAKAGIREVLLGTAAGSPALATYLAKDALLPEEMPEAYSLTVKDGKCVVCGWDDSGLMYGCFDLAEKLSLGLPLESYREKPYLKTRGIYELPHNRDLETRFYSKEYWTEYFGMLAKNRINSFNYVYSHQTGYMTPLFPYFLRDEKYPDVVPDDVTPQTVKRNYEMMRFITDLAYARGIEFILGIWEVIPWPGNEGDWRPPQISHVKNLTPDILEDYVYRSTLHMLQEFPHIAGIQVRVNEESGIPEERQTGFFERTIFKAVSEAGRLMDYRGWKALPETTETVKRMCPNLRMSMKYWAEFMGAPYQPGKISPGYSYGDLLKKPMEYRFFWQVWSLGSPRLLLWGDPDYVRRFVESCRLGNSEGFEINPPLAQKGYGNEPGAWRIFKHPEDEYYTHEYERYWMFYLLFGRLAYSPSTSDAVWRTRLEWRVGAAADKLMTAYRLSSQVITFLVQYSLSDPNMYIWPETDLGGLLEYYIQTPTSDTCVLQTVPERIKALREGLASGKQSPEESMARFRVLSEGIQRAVAACPPAGDNKELASSLLDFTVMAYLARYHAFKIEAGLALEGYFQTGDGSGLERAQASLRQATVTWEQMIKKTENFYYDKMVTGPADAGCWKAKRRLLYEDELRLSEIVGLHRCYGLWEKAFDFGGMVTLAGFENNDIPMMREFSVERRFLGVTADAVYTPDIGYGFVSGKVQEKGMSLPRITDRTEDWLYRRDAVYDVDMSVMRAYRFPLWEDHLYGTGEAVFVCDLPDGNYVVTLVCADQTDEARIHGPFSAKINGLPLIREEMLMPLDVWERTARMTVSGGKLTLTLQGSDWLVTALIIRADAPALAHLPPRVVPAGARAVLRATVTAPDGQELKVSVLCGEQAMPMRFLGSGHYEADVETLLSDGKAMNYQIAVDWQGKRIQSAEYTLIREAACPCLIHKEPKEVPAGKALTLRAELLSGADGDGVRVLLHYSRLNQYDALETVEMCRTGKECLAEIPGEYITPDRDLMYYFEVLGVDGQGRIQPFYQDQTPYYVVSVTAPEDAKA